MIIRMMAVASAAALLAGAAHAQASDSSPSQTGAPAVSDTAGQPPVDGADAQTSTAGPAPTDTTGYNSRAGASAAPSDATSAPSVDATAAPQPAVTDTTVVSNGPVPDTAANRAKYGQPDSATGKRTRATGN